MQCSQMLCLEHTSVVVEKARELPVIQTVAM